MAHENGARRRSIRIGSRERPGCCSVRFVLPPGDMPLAPDTPGRPVALRRGRRLVRIAAGLALVTAGCGGTPELEKALDGVSSWTAAVRLAGEERRAGATTARYTSGLRDEAASALERARRTLATAARTPAERVRAAAATDALARSIAALDAASGR